MRKAEDVDSASRFDIALDLHNRSVFSAVIVFFKRLAFFYRLPSPAFTFVSVFMASSFRLLFLILDFSACATQPQIANG